MHGLSTIGEMPEYERAYLNLRPEALKKLGCGQIDLDRFFRSYTARGQMLFQLSREKAQKCVEWIDYLQNHQEAGSELQRFSNCSVLLNFLSAVCETLNDTEPVPCTVISNNIMQ